MEVMNLHVIYASVWVGDEYCMSNSSEFASTGEKEWYFYCPRDRKYRNSARPNRVTGAGFWKATGTDRPIYSSEGNKCIGLKKSLVFYKGRAAKGVKTDWMMHEFRLPSPADSFPSKRSLDKTLTASDSWAICRIFKKTSPITPRTLSHCWVSPSFPNPDPNSTSSNNHALDPCISNSNSHLSLENIIKASSSMPSDPMQPKSNNAINHELDNIPQSPYPFSLLDVPTFKPIYPPTTNNNTNDKAALLNNYNHLFSDINPAVLDLPPSYILPQLKDPSDHQPFKSNIDTSSMLLMGDFGKPHDVNMEFDECQDFYQDYQSELMGDLSDLVHFEDNNRRCGGRATLESFPVEGLLPLDFPDQAWKSSTPLVWDCAPLS